MSTADGRALLQTGVRGHTRAAFGASCEPKGDQVRAEVTGHGGHTTGAQASAAPEPSLAELIAELASAGLVSIEVRDDGDVSYALTEAGQSAARSMAMSRQAHALVLLGALLGTDEYLN